MNAPLYILLFYHKIFYLLFQLLTLIYHYRKKVAYLMLYHLIKQRQKIKKLFIKIF